MVRPVHSILPNINAGRGRMFMSDKICSHPGCSNKVGRGGAKGLCPHHYHEYRLKTCPPCSVDGCSKPGICAGLCQGHYHKKQKYGDPTYVPVRPPRKRGNLKCIVDGCEGLYVAHGYCSKHYERFKKTGSPFLYSRRVSGEYTKYRSENNCYKKLIQRCTQKNDPSYKYYGGRGIKVCDRWLGPDGFHNFLVDMGPRPKGKHPSGRPEYTLDRIDVDGPYSPENCRWTNDWVQANNKTDRDIQTRGVHFVKQRGTYRANITIRGKTITKNFKTFTEAQTQRQKWEEKYKVDI